MHQCWGVLCDCSLLRKHVLPKEREIAEKILLLMRNGTTGASLSNVSEL